MAYIDIDIEDHLDEVSSIDLINELKSRKDHRSKEFLKELNEELKIDAETTNRIYEFLQLKSVRDKLKFEAFMNKFHNVPESELDNFLSKY